MLSLRRYKARMLLLLPLVMLDRLSLQVLHIFRTAVVSC